jgi:hypothetical protein
VANVGAVCNHCWASVDPYRDEPCPHCGQEAGKRIGVEITDQLQTRDSVSWERRREFWEVNWPWLVLVGVISVVSPFVGLVIAGLPGVVVGLLIGVVEFVVGIYAIGKVREITRGGDQ